MSLELRLTVSAPVTLPDRVTVNCIVAAVPVSVMVTVGDDSVKFTATTADVESKSTFTLSTDTVTFEDMETGIPSRVNAAVTT